MEVDEIFSSVNYKILEFKKNQIIFNSEDECKNIYMLIEGEVEIQKNLESGKIYNILYKGIGDTLGGGILFSDSKKFQMDIMAKTDCKLLQISGESVRKILCHDSIICANIMNMMGNTIMNFNKRVELFAVTSIQRKIAFVLLNALEESEGNYIRFPISKKQWAEHLNVSRTSLSRELKKLLDDDVIAIEKNRILIKNAEYLKEIVQNC